MDAATGVPQHIWTDAGKAGKQQIRSEDGKGKIATQSISRAATRLPLTPDPSHSPEDARQGKMPQPGRILRGLQAVNRLL